MIELLSVVNSHYLTALFFFFNITTCVFNFSSAQEMSEIQSENFFTDVVALQRTIKCHGFE